jgi:hypothetical protein
LAGAGADADAVTLFWAPLPARPATWVAAWGSLLVLRPGSRFMG